MNSDLRNLVCGRPTNKTYNWYDEKMKYPEFAQELLLMAQEDQDDARNMHQIMDAMTTDAEREAYRQKMADGS